MDNLIVGIGLSWDILRVLDVSLREHSIRGEIMCQAGIFLELISNP